MTLLVGNELRIDSLSIHQATCLSPKISLHRRCATWSRAQLNFWDDDLTIMQFGFKTPESVEHLFTECLASHAIFDVLVVTRREVYTTTEKLP